MILTMCTGLSGVKCKISLGGKLSTMKGLKTWSKIGFMAQWETMWDLFWRTQDCIRYNVFEK